MSWHAPAQIALSGEPEKSGTTGAPIVDDDVHAMKFGPVLSQTYDLIKCPERHIEIQTIWSAHFRVVDRIQLEMVKEPGTDHLSDYDVEILTAIAHHIRTWTTTISLS